MHSTFTNHVTISRRWKSISGFINVTMISRNRNTCDRKDMYLSINVFESSYHFMCIKYFILNINKKNRAGFDIVGVQFYFQLGELYNMFQRIRMLDYLEKLYYKNVNRIDILIVLLNIKQ